MAVFGGKLPNIGIILGLFSDYFKGGRGGHVGGMVAAPARPLRSPHHHPRPHLAPHRVPGSDRVEGGVQGER